jgi:hypothetical protein
MNYDSTKTPQKISIGGGTKTPQNIPIGGGHLQWKTDSYYQKDTLWVLHGRLTVIEPIRWKG